MKQRYTLITALALFSLFFGAGNLILPPQLGFRSGESWWLVALGFAISAVLIPILGIFAHARLQGTLYDFGKKFSPLFSLVYCFLIYTIAVTLPAPRTASVTHEIAISPIVDIPSIVTSLIYYCLVMFFAFNRSRMISVIGKWLTPIILLVLLVMIGSITFYINSETGPALLTNNFSLGLEEGYQTFDAIGAVVSGAVLIVSLNLDQKELDTVTKFKIISRAGLYAGLALLFLYAGLIYAGSQLYGFFTEGEQRTTLLRGLGEVTLGSNANYILVVLITLACLTTAIGIVTGTADFVSSRFSNSKLIYRITVWIGCTIGVLMGQLNVGFIIDIAIPVLMLIYPLTIILILLNLLPEKWIPPIIFRGVVLTVLLFSIPDFLSSLGYMELKNLLISHIPIFRLSLFWVIPATFVFFIMHGVRRIQNA